MTDKTVAAELKAVLKMEPKAGDTSEAFARKLVLKANNMADGDWEALSSKAQVWVNAGLEAIEKKRAVPLPEGLEATPEEPEKPKKPTVKDKVAATKKKAAANGKKAASGLGPKGKFSKTDKVKVVPKENPFRAGTKCHVWFGFIQNGMTVEEAVVAGAPRHHIRWAHSLGHLEIGG